MLNPVFFCIILSLFSLSCLSEPLTNSRENIAASKEWRALLHFESHQSKVDDSDYFLHSEGSTSPLKELNASVDAFYLPADTPQQHAICRYPARWKMLQDKLQLSGTPIDLTQCDEYQKWIKELNPNSVTLVFASAYLNSPSSMFGHTFLRIDPAKVEDGSALLSYAVNFGAKVNSDDNSILYAYRGLFGGYPGYFGVIPYYEKIKEYNRIENRDLWEYNLNLTPKETQRLADHLWELREVKFDYYFFDENCSYRLLELFEYARPGVELTDSFSVKAIPIDTVRVVEENNLVRNIVYRPSIATQIQFQADRLTTPQQKLAWQLAHKEIKMDNPSITKLPESQQAQVLRVAYEHLRYRQLGKARDKDAAKLSFQLLKRISKLKHQVKNPETPQIVPHQGHRTQLLGISAGQQEDQDFYDIRIRMSYHDLMDNTAGYLKGASINIGEARIRKLNGESAQLEQLNFIEISSHSPRNRFFKPVTWRVEAGFERMYSPHIDYLAPQLNGGAGVTYPLGNSLIYTLASARLEYNELFNSNWAVGAGATAGGLIYFPFGTLQVESQYLSFSNSEERYQHQLIQNFNITRNQALRLKASHSKQIDTTTDEFSVEFRHFF